MESRTPYSLQTPEWFVFLRLLCAYAEGTLEIRVGVEPARALVAAASACVCTVLSDSQSRLTVMGGRENMPRSLGSVYGGAVARFLGGFRGRFTHTIPTTGLWPHGGVAVSRDGYTLLVTDYRGGSHAVHIYCVRTGAFLRTIGSNGHGPLQFSFPLHIAVSSDGFVFVADSGNDRIQVLTPQYEFHAFVGSGQLRRPHGVCADDEFVVVASPYRHDVCVFKRGDNALICHFGSLGSGDGQLRYPRGVCFMSGHVAVVDFGNCRVSVWTLDGEFVRYIGDGDLNCPCGVACSDAGELIVADSAKKRVFVFSASDEIVWTPQWLVFLRLLCAYAEGTLEIRVGVDPARALVAAASACVYTVLSDSQSRLTVMGGRKNMPRSLGSVYGGAVTRCLGGFRGGFTRTIPTSNHGGMAVSRDGSTLLVTDVHGGSHAVHIYSVHSGAFLRTIGGYGHGPLQFCHPHRVCVSSDGFVFVTDWGNHCIQVLTPEYEFHAFVGKGHLQKPFGVGVNHEIIAASNSPDDVCVFKRSDGAFIRRFGSLGSGDGQLRYPTDVCCMSGHVAVLDYCNRRVSLWTPDGDFVRHFGVGNLESPIDVRCSDANELIVADSKKQRVFVFSASGEIVWESAAGNFGNVAVHGSTIYCQRDVWHKCSVFS